jgi:hypothetical protein
MKTFLRTILCMVFVVVGSLAFGQPARVSFTVDGVTYQDVHFGEKHGDSVDVFHSAGVRSIPMEKLPPEIQKQLGYRPKKAAKPQAPVQKPTVEKPAAPKPPTQKPVVQKTPEQKPPVQKPAAPKPPAPETAAEESTAQKTPEQKTNIEKLTVQKPEVQEPAAPKSPVKKTPVQKPPPPETPVQKPDVPATVEKAPMEKPAAKKPAREKPPVKKPPRQRSPVRKAMEVPNKIEAARWLKENEKKVWAEVWSNYDDAAREANDKHSATSDSETWRDYQEQLWLQHNADLCSKLGLTQPMLKGLIEKGYREDWPIEKSPEDKVKIANDAGVKPVSDETDGAVAEVVSYLGESRSDSKTTEYLRWYPPLLEDTKDGYSWAVEVKYRSKGADGKPVVEAGTAYIRHNKVVDFKVRPTK